ncbi:tRNA G18 (ribose-2'-O)-methylase SpoU [Pseudoxanthobacter soli DSM 19599]|uniref:tRNA G18 (Ribose-2'-O)-methylase SpoU n=1 Tax=Pseudoxanthobacter soli DSM 19599 TaxID=1123029 RepID=A0A1M7ZFF1_9HYPH|nr:RNA methyltransferase [Pseudoxanthobacter soli]SHO63630.1 tRNA G18 (ribose-2'-O)-methylase SpoU [Pseudoxanthobacter soli DSM 19599]
MRTIRPPGREVIPVAEADDPRVADYRDVRERDLVGRDGRFVIEGEVVLDVALSRSRFALSSVLIAADRVPRLGALIDRVPPDVPVYGAAPAVMDAIVGFPIHRGILAIGLKGAAPDAAAALAALPLRALVVGLVGLANHDNVGGIFRNAAAFGAGLVLVDRGCCDPLYRKAIRVSAGGVLAVPFAPVPNGGAMIDLLDEAGFEVIALSPRGDETLARLTPPPRAALLLGAEGPGLPAEMLARTRTVRIPMQAFDSLNVATTSGIALHHLVHGG